MKKTTLFLILILGVLFANAQIQEVYSETFDSGAPSYNGSGRTTTESYYSAPNAYELKPSKTDTMHLTTNEIIIDKSTPEVFLEFYHVNTMLPNNFLSAEQYKGGLIQIRNMDSPEWVTLLLDRDLVKNEYNDTLPQIGINSFYNINSYSGIPGWDTTSYILRREVLSLTRIIANYVTQGNRYMIRFVVPKANPNANVTDKHKWIIDNIRIYRSQYEMVRPKLSMGQYPIGEYPENKKAVIKATVEDNSSLNGGNTYIEYRYGSSPWVRQPIAINLINTTPDFYTYSIERTKYTYDLETEIPFRGYDTLINWRVLVEDGSPNKNASHFPLSGDSLTFKFVRSFQVEDSLAYNAEHTIELLRNRSGEEKKYKDGMIHAVYNRNLLHERGYQGGIIEGLSFNIHSANEGDRVSLTVSIQNDDSTASIISSPSQYVRQGKNMEVVYSNTSYALFKGWQYIPFDKEFKYNGAGDIRITICLSYGTRTENVTDSVTLKAFPIVENKLSGTKYRDGRLDCADSTLTYREEVRPNLMFRMRNSDPLNYDAGVTQILSPQDVYEVGNNKQPIKVEVTNFGEENIDNLKLYYQIDGGNIGSSIWQRPATKPSFGKGDTAIILVEDSVEFTIRTRKLCVWTGDTINGDKPDYEERNNKFCNKFIMCENIEGVRFVGNGGDYESLQDVLDNLGGCGIVDNITFQIYGGVYNEKLQFPTIAGLDNYSITFEPYGGQTVNLVYETTEEDRNLIDLTKVKNIKFKNINFEITGGDNEQVSLLALGNEKFVFENCTFKSNINIESFIKGDRTAYTQIEGCAFEGAKNALSFINYANLRSRSNLIINNKFFYQTENVLYFERQARLMIHNNEIRSESELETTYLASLFMCEDSSYFSSNRIISEKGSACLLVQDYQGTSTKRSFIINNMLSSSGDNALTVATISGAEYVTFAYNSLYLNSTNTGNIIPTAVQFISTFQDIQIKNNIFFTKEEGYSIDWQTQRGSLYTISNNNYYTENYKFIAKSGGTIFTSFSDWKNSIGDNGALNILPRYISYEDLRTYEPLLKNEGVPVDNVNEDIFNSARNVTNPSIGAFEIPQLEINIVIEEFLTPVGGCNLKNNEPVKIVLKNEGYNDYIQGAGNVYLLNSSNGKLIPNLRGNGGRDTIEFTANVAAINKDTTFILTAWVDNQLEDLDKATDTLSYRVRSLYTPERILQRDSIINIPYQTDVLIDLSPFSGEDSVYWFKNESDDLSDAFHSGSIYRTDILYDTTNYYVARKQEKPAIRITEVQVRQNGNGMESSSLVTDSPFAIEISNVGNVDAMFENDTLEIKGHITKRYLLPKIVIKPQASFLVSYSGAKASADSSKIIYVGVEKYDPEKNLFIRLGKNGNFYDFVAINIDTEGSPYIYTAGTNTAGITRVAYDGLNSDWRVATDSRPLTMGTIDDDVMSYSINSCKSEMSKITVSITNPPRADVRVVNVGLNAVEGACNLQDESVAVRIENNGTDDYIPGNTIIINYSVDGSPVRTTTWPYDLGRNEDTVVVFPMTEDFRSSTEDKIFKIKAWITNFSQYNLTNNDTLDVEILSLRTPLPPVTKSPDTVSYGDSLTFELLAPLDGRDLVVWYAKDSVTEISRETSFRTGRFFARDTFYVQSIGVNSKDVILEEGSYRVSQMRNYPAPYTAPMKYSKQQFIISSTELRAAGLIAGSQISGVQFYLDSLAPSEIIFDKYSIYLGDTNTSVAFPSVNVTPFLNMNSTPLWDSAGFSVKKSDEYSWIKHPFNKNYLWDGISDIIIQICTEANSATTGNGFSAFTRSIDKGRNLQLYSASNTIEQCSVALGSKGSPNTQRPNIRLLVDSLGCAGNKAPKYIDIIDIPDKDLALDSILSVQEYGNTIDTKYDLDILLRNQGDNTIDTIDVYWLFADMTTPEHFQWVKGKNGNGLPNGDTAIISFPDTLSRSEPGRYPLKVWFDVEGDTYNENDTILMHLSFCYPKKSNGDGSYIIAKDGSGDFLSFQEAVDNFVNAGICESIIVKVKDGSYYENVRIPNIYGLSQSVNLTFTPFSNSDIVNIIPSGTDDYVVEIVDNEGIVFENIGLSPKSGSCGFRIIDSRNIKLLNNNITHSMRDASSIILSGSTEDILIKSNIINFPYTGVLVDTLNNKGTHDGLQISNNIITGFYYAGIYVSNTTNELDIIGNKVSSNYSDKKYGIYVYNNTANFNIIGNEVQIQFTDNASGKTKKGFVIERSLHSSAQYSLFANNMSALYYTSGNTNTTEGHSAFEISNSRYINVYNNTGSVDTANLGAKGGIAISYVFGLTNGSYGIRSVNNIFINVTGGYVYRLENVASLQRSDYNNLVAASPQSNKIVIVGTSQNTFDNWRRSTARDSNSYMISDFSFVNSLNLRLTSPLLNEKGTNLNNLVNNDIDGQKRATKPALGAFEYQKDTVDVHMYNGSLLTSNNVYEEAILPIKLWMYNWGAFPIDTVRLHVVGRYSSIDTTYTVSFATPLPFGMMDSATIRVYIPRGYLGYEDLIVFSEQDGDANHLNDTLPRININIANAYDLSAKAVRILGAGDASCGYKNMQVSFDVEKMNKGFNILKDPSFDLWIHYTLTGKVEGTQVFQKQISQNVTDSLPFIKDIMSFVFDETVDLDPYVGTTNIVYEIVAKVDFSEDTQWNNDEAKDGGYIIYPKPRTPQVFYSGNTVNYYYYESKILEATQLDSLAIVWHDNDGNLVYTHSSYVMSEKYQTPPLRSSTTYKLASKNAYGCISDTLNLAIVVDQRPNHDVTPIEITSPKDSLVYTLVDTIKVKILSLGVSDVAPGEVIKVSYRVNKDTIVVMECETEYTGGLKRDSIVEIVFSECPVYFNSDDVFRITAAASINNDVNHINDTLRRNFYPGKEDAYCKLEPNLNNISSYTSNGIDITRVELGAFVNETPPAGNKYTNFASRKSPLALDPIELYKGWTDTLSITCTRTSVPPSNQQSTGYMAVYIDWNRDGVFDTSANSNEYILAETYLTGTPVKKLINVPEDVITGGMIMRIVTGLPNERFRINPCLTETVTNVEYEDYLLFVRPAHEKNAALVTIESPEVMLLNTPEEIVIRVANRGKETIDGAAIKWYFGETPSDIRSHTIEESLTSNMTSLISIKDAFPIVEGKNQFTAWIEVANDGNPADDTLRIVFYKPPVKMLPFSDSFDEDNYTFTAPESPYILGTNYWKKDTVWNSTSDLAWVVRSGPIQSNIGGNVSYLYSPIFDISQGKPDTISFEMKRNLRESTKLYIEYLDRNFEWKLLGETAGRNNSQNWYNETAGYFSGTNRDDQLYSFYSMFLDLETELGNIFQIRFVYTHTADTRSDDPGNVIINNFYLGNSPKRRDMAVLEIDGGKKVLSVNRGYVYEPKVFIMNRGTSPVISGQCMICYELSPSSYGNSLRNCFYLNNIYLPYLGNTIIDFANPNYQAMGAVPIEINSQMPDSMRLFIYSVLGGEEAPYNDTAWIDLIVLPHPVDLGIENVIYPMDKIPASTQTDVAIEIRNRGARPIEHTTASYSLNGGTMIRDSINFLNLIGDYLQPGESYTYRFNEKINIPFYGKSVINVSLNEISQTDIGPGRDGYLQNNTFVKPFETASNINDVQALYIILDSTEVDSLNVQLHILNASSYGINLLDVGYSYITGEDTLSSAEKFWTEKPIKASSEADYRFTKKIPKTDADFSLFAYVYMENDSDRRNDTTWIIKQGKVDISPIILRIEETPDDSQCRMELSVANVGTLVVDEVEIEVTVDGKSHKMLYNEYPIFPGQTNKVILNSTTDKKDGSTYNVFSRVTVKNDVNSDNDTTSKYEITPLIVGIDDVDSLEMLRLDQNYPNPFSEMTEFKFYIPTGGNVKVFIINTQGQLVHTEERVYASGEHTYRFNSRNFASGVYYYGIELKDQRRIKKMILRR